MSHRVPGMGRRAALFALAAGVALMAVVGIALSDPATPPLCRDHVAIAADGEPINVVRQLRSTDDGYELELWSREQFPVRAMPTILRVGRIDTGLSRLVFDGQTIVFAIPPEEYERMDTGDPILIHHTFIPQGLEENPNIAGDVLATNGANLWTFGRFDKSQLDCPPIALPEDSAA